jgi:hypothetical protein
VAHHPQERAWHELRALLWCSAGKEIMKLKFTSEYVRKHFHGKNMPPLRTFREMAEEFGVTDAQLRSKLERLDDAPKPKMKHQNRYTKNTWYDPVEIRAWWKRHNMT